jgi:glycerol dehydrogenase
MMIMGAPNRYVQGQGLIDRAGEMAGKLGDRFFIFGDEIVLSLYGERIARGFEDANKECFVEKFKGECCYAEISRLSHKAKSNDSQVIVGIGGGKAADTAKAISIQLGYPLAIIPTIASTDAPTSHVAIIYDENQIMKEALRMKPTASLVLVDTSVIAQAPVRYLVAGMGDALSTRFEAEACFESGALNVFGGRSCQAALHLSRMTYEIIRKYGEDAVMSVIKKEATDALEKVVEANILLSGLGFESGGLAAAHAVEAGLSRLKEIRGSLHGERVAYGTLVQLVLEGKDMNELQDIMDFYKKIGLPTSLKQLGLLSFSMEGREKVVDFICREGSFVYNMPFKIVKEAVIESIIKVESLAGN